MTQDEIRDLEAWANGSGGVQDEEVGDLVSRLISAYRKATAPIVIDCEARWGVATITTDPQDAVKRLTERAVSLRGLLAEVQDRLSTSASCLEATGPMIMARDDEIMSLRASLAEVKDELSTMTSDMAAVAKHRNELWNDRDAARVASHRDEARELAKAYIVRYDTTPGHADEVYRHCVALLRNIDEAQAAEKGGK